MAKALNIKIQLWWKICKITVVDRINHRRIFGAAKQAARSAVEGLNYLLWPAVCVNCRGSISQADCGLCESCWGELVGCSGGDYCRRCGRDASRYAILEGGCPDCQGREIYFDGIARGGVYDGALGKMILTFKSGDRIELDERLGFLAEAALQGSGFYKTIEMFVAVPLHWRRRFVRGYNQAAVIAAKLKHPSAKISADFVRVRHTRKQVSVSLGERAVNVAGAFAVRKGHKFAGRNICLVDDIKTTGATLNECARTLKQAGASKVYALVMAVAGQNMG